MSNFRFVVCPIANDPTPIGELTLSTVSFNDPVRGTGGAFSGKLEMPPLNAPNRDLIKSQITLLTQPQAMALYVFDPDVGTYLFGGPIMARPWDRTERRLNIQAISWKTWMYLKLYNVNFSVNPPVDSVYNVTATDQFSIARGTFLAQVNSDVGCPTINLGTELSGINRDVSGQGSQFKYLGDLIDSMANRDNGFDWNINVEPASNGDPRLWFRPYYPFRGAVNNTILLIHQLPNGGNILELNNPEETADAMRTRCWATGAGQPPDMLFAYDQDPALASDLVLLTERIDNYTTVTNISTLAQHARTARLYYGKTLQQVQMKVAIGDPDYRVYASGDKVRLLVQDDWLDWDFNAVRIIDRTFLVNNEGGSPAPDQVQLTLDLNDTELPENDTQV